MSLELAKQLRELERELLKIENETISFLAKLPGQHAGSPRLYDSEALRRKMRHLASAMEKE